MMRAFNDPVVDCCNRDAADCDCLLATEVQVGDQVMINHTTSSAWGLTVVSNMCDVTKITNRGGKITITGTDDNGKTRRMTFDAAETIRIY